MKIAYIFNDKLDSYSGVVQKILSQTEEWKKYNHEVELFSISNNLDKNNSKNIFSRFFHYQSNIINVLSHIDKFNPDLIYSRLISYSPYIKKALEKYPLVVEINGNDVEERFKKNTLLGIFNLFTRDMYLYLANGFVFVSSELQNHKVFKKYNKKSIVIPNGAKFNPKDISTNKNSTPTCVFIGTPGHPYHGVDKIIKLAKYLHDVEFRIIGYDETTIKNIDNEYNKNSNVYIYGFLDSEKSRSIISQSHVGISSLSFHLYNMNEAPTLKSRTYVTCGLPVILGQYDPDLSSNPSPYVLQIDNTPTNVEDFLNDIHSFILKSVNTKPQEIIDNLFPLIDIRIKEQKRLSFMSDILQNRKK